MNHFDFADDGPPLSRAQNETLLLEAEQAPRGVILAPDDIEVGDLITVYDLQLDPTEFSSIMGQALRVKAVQLPFIVGGIVADRDNAAMTLDVRYLRFMRVSEEFAAAQAPAPLHGTDSAEFAAK